MEVRIETHPDMHLAGLLHEGAYSGVGRTWQRFFSLAESSGLVGPGFLAVGVYYHNPRITPEAEQRAHAAMVWSPDAPLPHPEFEAVHVPGGRYAVYTHHGAYSGLPDAWYQFVEVWMKQPGRVFREGPCLEIYRGDVEHMDPAKLFTDLYVPVE
ncbi:MAG: GyrI-like domain-containing protein [Candidatus Sumerlaeia bacterium]|nr:GyrI-like domain-containing protein [Candidatus Sumerlaeia bacterium]